MNARRSLMAAALMLGGVLSPASAQTWRTLTASRPLGRDDSLRVVVRYGMGKLTLRAADPAVLYDLSMRYDANIFRTQKSYDPASHTLSVGADSATAERFSLRPHFFGGDNAKAVKDEEKVAEMTLGIARGIPLDLNVKTGIGASVLDLGNLWIANARIESTMGEMMITFSTANQRPMQELRIDAMMSGLGVKELGNARAKTVKMSATLGGGEANLRGDWTGDMTLDVTVAVGGLQIRVPRDAGVKITALTHLGGIDAAGFTEKDGEYTSPNYATATRKVLITGSVSLGGLKVTWVDQ
jgi:hypothetical protein